MNSVTNPQDDQRFGGPSFQRDKRYYRLFSAYRRKTAPGFVNFDLFEELEYDLYIAKLSAKHKDLNFKVEFAKNLPNYLNSDPSRMRQVLNNIISNALKYTEQGGSP